jgi:hypothetical protein
MTMEKISVTDSAVSKNPIATAIYAAKAVLIAAGQHGANSGRLYLDHIASHNISLATWQNVVELLITERQIKRRGAHLYAIVN